MALHCTTAVYLVQRSCLYRSFLTTELAFEVNQRGHWVRWMSTTRKNGLMWRTYTHTVSVLIVRPTSVVERYRIGRCMSLYHTPLVRFSKLDCSTTKRVLLPNDTPAETSRRGVYNADLVGAGTSPTVEISTTENRPRVYTVVYTVQGLWSQN